MIRGGIVPRLIVIKGPDVGKQFELDGEVSGIGREASNTLRLHDTEASRKHAEFRRGPEGNFRVVDLGSANGTFVNTKAVGEAALQSGDHVQIGQTILVFTSTRAEAPTQSGKLAEQIRMITRNDESPSEIVKTIAETEGSRLLAKPETVDSPWLKTKLANLGVIYDAIQAISHILEIDPLLERIMQLTFQSIEADRGCIMLKQADSGAVEPKAVRYREGVNAAETIGISRTIVDYVLREKQGVLVTDASRDDRFSSGQSIVRFGIREAICVPMKGRHETVGVLYLDTQSTSKEIVAKGEPTGGKFTEDHLSLAIALAHQAALAIEETRYHQALVDAERLAAIGQTIASLSHHIKNILQGLRSGSEILKMGMAEKDDDLMQKGWRVVEKNQGKIYDLVLDMLSFSKDREPAIESTNLNQIIEDVVELVKGRAEETGARLELRLDPNMPKVPADSEGIHRAILNLVGNALDAVSDRDNGQIGLQTLMETNGEWARVIVIDNGPGIPPEKLFEIFKPFVSSKGAKGTGLGLPVSRKILREHGGDILLQSQVGKGTKFTLRLPMKSPLFHDVTGPIFQIPPPPD
jgi:signal transduction histidine kinase/pSer/pThr/pTyr-binding forkhead associated (FHA) protein